MKIQHFLAALFCCFLATTTLQAQSADKPWTVGFNVGKTSYQGDLGSGFFKPEKAFHGNVGMSFSRYLNPTFNVSLNGSYGRYGYMKDENSQDKKISTVSTHEGNFLSNKGQANIMLDFKFNNGWLLPEDFKLSPFLSAGLGAASYTAVNRRGTNDSDFILPVGGGLNYRINDMFNIYWQSTYAYTNGDSVDGIVTETDNVFKFGSDDWWMNQVGLKISFGKTMDTDGDGVSDNKDTCPTVPGKLAFMGCPDSDNDGIQDSKDNCPTAAGIAMFNGCPDTDHDGVMDSEDSCPTQKGMAHFNGCPDTDGDGVADNKDNCPTVKGVMANKGCPVQKAIQPAPTRPAPRTTTTRTTTTTSVTTPTRVVTAPTRKVVSSSTLSVFREALDQVQFETGKSIIKSNSFNVLSKVVRIMNENPTMRLNIEGYTDSQGADVNNLRLSQSRADAVKTYLTSKGISPMRMTATGFGEASPVADNATKEGRAKNRRVELKANY